jgi:hypothetical protein
MAVYEWRTYDIAIGRLAEYVDFFEREGLPVLSQYAEPAGFWFSGPADTGPLNQVNHLWRYESIAHRTQQRTALYADPAWSRGFAPASLALIERLHSRLLAADGEFGASAGSPASSSGERKQVVATVYSALPQSKPGTAGRWRLLTDQVGDWLTIERLEGFDFRPSGGAIIRSRQIWTSAAFSRTDSTNAAQSCGTG